VVAADPLGDHPRHVGRIGEPGPHQRFLHEPDAVVQARADVGADGLGTRPLHGVGEDLRLPAGGGDDDVDLLGAVLECGHHRGEDGGIVVLRGDRMDVADDHHPPLGEQRHGDE